MQFWKQNTISVRKRQKSCFASHFEFVVSYAITITILAYLLHLAKLCNTNEILSEEVCIFISKYIQIFKFKIEENYRQNAYALDKNTTLEMI